MDLCFRLKLARKEAGFKSQEKFAAVIGSTRNAIARYESGDVVPNDVFLKLVARQLNISFDWLKFGTGNMYDGTVDPLETLLDGELEDIDKQIIRIYISLPPEHRKILRDFARKIAGLDGTQQEAPPIMRNLDVTEEEYRRIMQDRNARELEKGAAVSSASGA